MIVCGRCAIRNYRLVRQPFMIGLVIIAGIVVLLAALGPH
jgi:hypothetical protein